MKNFKLLLFNNLISFLIFVVYKLSEPILYMVGMFFSSLVFKFIPLISGLAVILLWMLLPLFLQLLFCCFAGKKFFFKVEKLWCYFSPILFLICSLSINLTIFPPNEFPPMVFGNVFLYLMLHDIDFPNPAVRAIVCGCCNIILTMINYFILVYSIIKKPEKLK